MERLIKTIERYDKIAKDYERKFGKLLDSEKIYLEKFYSLVSSLSKTPRILDAGCGTGRDLSYFESIHTEAELYGVDLSIKMLMIAKSKLKNTNLFRCDIRKLPFPSGFFDGIFSIAVLVHLTNNEKEEAIREFRRLLKPNGVLYVCIQNLLYPPRFFRSIKYRKWKNVIYDERYWYFPTKFSLDSMLKRNGFETIYSSSAFSKRLRYYARKKSE